MSFLDARYIGTITVDPTPYAYGYPLLPRHSGVFKFWPRVHEMWRTRTYGTKTIRTIDFERPEWDMPPSSYEMERYCGRRR